MNIQTLHTPGKEISFVPVFSGEAGTVTAMQLPANQTLKKHTTKIAAFLICITGKVVYHNENGVEEILLPGDYVKIEPMVEHWVDGGPSDSNLLLIK